MTRAPQKPRDPQLHTLASLTARCEAEGPCLIWPGIGASNKKIARPMIFHAGVRQPVRRLFAILRGDPLALAEEAGQTSRGYWAVTCGDPHCMASNHTVRRDKAEHYTAMRAKGNSGITNTIRVAKIAHTRRTRSGKLSPEQISAIRSSDHSITQEAARHGVSTALISRMRRRDLTVMAGNPFSGLGGRA